MKKHFSLFTCILFVLTGISCSTMASVGDKFDVKNTKAILISVAMSEIHSSKKIIKDGGLLITDSKEIAKYVELFDGNSKAVSHACGYHWQITFQKEGAEQTEIYINQNCEEFNRSSREIHKFLKPKFDQIATKSEYFISNVAIDVNTSPEEAIQKLTENTNYKVFVLDNLENRFPSIEIQATAISDIPEDKKLWDEAKRKNSTKAENILRNEIEKIQSKYPVVKIDEIQSHYSSFGGGKIEERPTVRISFPIGTNLGDFERILKETIIKDKYIADTYTLQIVSKKRLSAIEIKQMSDMMPFIKGVSTY
ncbi:MAG: hypothetical protein ACR2MD_02015 [Aridibacter sp.]|jgi:hypothetical protein